MSTVYPTLTPPSSSSPSVALSNPINNRRFAILTPLTVGNRPLPGAPLFPHSGAVTPFRRPFPHSDAVASPRRRYISLRRRSGLGRRSAYFRRHFVDHHVESVHRQFAVPTLFPSKGNGRMTNKDTSRQKLTHIVPFLSRPGVCDSLFDTKQHKFGVFTLSTHYYLRRHPSPRHLSTKPKSWRRRPLLRQAALLDDI